MFKRPLKSGKDVIVPSLIERDTYFLTIHDVDEMGKKSKKNGEFVWLADVWKYYGGKQACQGVS